MARYIDADKLEKDFPQSVSKRNVIINGNEYPVFLVDHVLHKIRNYPTADVVPKSEVERLQAELDSKQFRCDSCDRMMLTGAEHRACVKQAKAEVAKEIFEEIDGITELFAKGLIEELEMYDKLAELKKKYTGKNNENASKSL